MKLLLLIEKILQTIIPKKWRLALSVLRIKTYQFLSKCAIPYFYNQQMRYRKNVEKISKKDTLTVAFFVFQDAIWKYDSLYKALQQHKQFNPVVVVIPYIVYGKQSMISEMNKTTKIFNDKGYKVIKTYDETTDKYISIRKTLNPDIVFFSSPFRLTTSEYQITNYLDKLTAYVPYGIMAARIEEDQYNQLFHNLAWRCYYETPIHHKIAQKYSNIKATNVVITGYPLADQYLDKQYKARDIWTNKDPQVKRIIWAPHHTLEANATLYQYSNFIEYADYFCDICEKFKGKIQIAFKPHPILKLKLYNHPRWGKDKTDKYYTWWNSTPNCQLEESDYTDLFITSDALIHDSISFMTEYIYTTKPALFMLRNNRVENEFNQFGKIALNVSYRSYNRKGVDEFIENVVMQANDPLKNKREKFQQQILKPPHNQSAISNIIGDIINNIWGN